MTGYLTVCFSDWKYPSFRPGIMKIREGKRTDEPIRRYLYNSEEEGIHYYVKPDPNFSLGLYSRCHRQLRVSLKPGDRLFFRTLWRGKPYLIGYFQIAAKNGEPDPICLADLKKSRLIDFKLEITPKMVKFIKPDLKDARHFNMQVTSALGRNYIRLSAEKTKYLTDLVDQYPNALVNT